MSTIDKDFRVSFSILYVKDKKRDASIQTDVIAQLWYDQKLGMEEPHLVYVTYDVKYSTKKGYSIFTDPVYYESESVHDQDNQEVYEHEIAEVDQRMRTRKTKLVKVFTFVFDKDSGVFHSRDDTDYDNKIEFLSALFSDIKKKDQKKVEDLLTKIIDNYNSGKKRDEKLLEQLESYIPLPENKSIELLKTIAALKRNYAKVVETKLHTSLDVLDYFFSEFLLLSIPDSGVKKERIFTLSITDISQKDGASIYYIPVDALRKKNKKLLENLEFGEDNWLSILKNVNLDQDIADDLLTELDVGDRLTEDDYNYKIVDTLSFWHD